MEGLVSSSRTVRQMTIRKINSSNSTTDLWFISRQGSLAELDSTLSSLKKNGGNIDSRNAFGLTPLHIATWRNHVPIVKRLLAAGADPNARDGESGWSSLHRALHFGHLAVASALLQSGASLTLEDSKGRLPADLLAGPVSQIVGNTPDSVATEVYSWGSGTNYQLGTGNAHMQKLPCKVALQGSYIRTISASKFHSVAVGSSGELYTWGFGRGGRLGHPDFDIHSGQAAVITPRQVTLGLGFRPVKSIAAAKHHTVIATESGEVFTWGSNREGQLGYTSVDTQPTPRRVSSLKARVIAVAAANKHTVAVAESGEIFTWGCNKEGQLGYGTSNSASNYIPRMVEYLKGKVFKGVSAAKYHTIALGTDGEVFTWGHRLVTPRRVSIARSLKKSGSAPLKFHRMERLHVISVAAGVAYSTALTDDGALFYWVSSDPNLRCQQMYSMGGRNIVSISAGKYWTAAATITGDVYMWDAKRCKDDTPTMTRLHGVKRATSVCVGETHLLVVSALYQLSYPPKLDASRQKPILEGNDELEDLDEGLLFDDIRQPTIQHIDVGNKHAPSLKSLCERVAADFLVEPRNAIQLLEMADSLEADDLRKYCEEIALRNLDYIFTVSAPAIASASPEILVRLEKLRDAKSSEPWSYRRLPTPTATFPAIIYSEEEGDDGTSLGFRDSHEASVFKTCGDIRAECFSPRDSAADQAVCKQVRALRKKLQQIEMLEAKQFSGHILDDQQISKLQTRPVLERMLAELGVTIITESQPYSPGSCDGKGNKKADASRKQRKKSKQKKSQVEALAASHGLCGEHISKNDLPDAKSLHVSKEKEIEDVKSVDESGIIGGSSSKSVFNSHKSKTLSSTKKRNKKGGLSMFLSGALDAIPKHAPPPPPTPPKTEGPAWGGTKFTKGSTSLRDIQNEQTKTREVVASSKSKDRTEDSVEPVSSGPVLLSSFMPSSPIPVVPVPVPVPATEGDKCTPPWSSTGTSPVLHRPYLRDIQLQQVKKQQSPKTRTSGFSVASSASDPKDAIPSRWFKPETDAPSSIRSIQIEEKAMKDLKRFYTNVKLVKSTHPQAFL